MGSEFVFMDDNTRPRRANIVSGMDWSELSSDLHPVEHVWDILRRRAAARNFGEHYLMSGVIFLKIRWIL
ncbi:hypothetical protein TNCV_3112611 [Trichonephila clavipes]|nr:hypothetical protein TNCV_3112611 [Trichonephila clavipes]